MAKALPKGKLPNFTRVRLDTTLDDFNALKKRMQTKGYPLSYKVVICSGMPGEEEAFVSFAVGSAQFSMQCSAYTDFRNNLRRVYLVFSEGCKSLMRGEQGVKEMAEALAVPLTGESLSKEQ